MTLTLAPLDTYQITGSGRMGARTGMRGADVPNYGRVRCKTAMRGRTFVPSSMRARFAMRGADGENFGNIRMRGHMGGFSGIAPPQANYGSIGVKARFSGTGYLQSFGEGLIRVRSGIRGADVPRYGRVRARTRMSGNDAAILQDGVILLLQGPGVITASAGYTIESLTDGLALGDGMQPSITVSMRDSFALGDQLATRGDFESAIADTLHLPDALAITFMQSLVDTLAMTDGIALSMRLAALVDSLVLSDAAVSTITAYQQISDALALHDAMQIAQLAEIDDSLALTDGIASTSRSLSPLLDTLAFDDAMAQTVILSCFLPDTLAFTDAAGSQLMALSLLEDAIGFSVRLQVDDGVYVAYAMNTSTKGASRYLNYPFNSFAEINGRLIGCKDDGLYVLKGDTDDGAPIDAKVRTGLDNLGSTAVKRMFKAYLGIRTNGDMRVKVVTTSPQGEKIEYAYDMIPVPAVDMRNAKVNIGKGLQSVYWSYEVANVAGSDFMLDTLSIIPLISGRRFNG